jgi:hypothetical protein
MRLAADVDEPRKRRTVLKQGQWLKLRDLAGLKESGRNRLENQIQIYRNGRGRISDRLPPAETREQLRNLSAKTKALTREFESAIGNETAWDVLNDQQGWDGIRLFQLGDELAALAEMTQHSADRITRDRPGPNTDNLANLVEALAAVWMESTGAELSSSKRRSGPDNQWNAVEFIATAVKAADPSMKSADGKIGNLIRQTIERVRPRKKEK